VSIKDKVVITAGLTGAVTRKNMNPGVPYLPEEWAKEVALCEQAGAAVIAVHFRDFESGDPTVDPIVMQETMDAITSNCNCIINLSTGVHILTPLEERKQPVVQFRPEMASLNPGSTNFSTVDWRTGEILADNTYVNPFNATLEFGQIMREKRIKPEMECFSPSHIENILWFQKYHDLAEAPLHFGLVFGVAGGMQFSEAMLACCTSLLPRDATWMGVGVGPNCWKITMAAAAFGGHIRVGLEDNLWLDNTTRSLSKGSYDQVEKAVAIAHQVGRGVASPTEARGIFHLRGESE